MKADGSREDRYMAAMCHAGILLPLSGAAISLVVWLTQRKQSQLLRFHALQALIYQAGGLLFKFALAGGYLALTVGSIFLIMAGSLLLAPTAPMAPPTSSNPASGGLEAIVIAVLFVLTLAPLTILGGLQCVLGLLIPLVGLWAAWRVLAGRSFRYPIIGRWVARRVDGEHNP